MKEESSKIIGPFLGPRGKTGVEIFIALPDHEETNLTCKIFERNNKNNEIKSCNYQIDESDIFKLFRFTFEGLDDNQTYTYEFFSDDKPLPLGWGLTKEDCNFRVLGENSEEKSFILMSCHNPFEKAKGSADEGWEVWNQLSCHLKKDKNVRLLVLGGDQVYNDDIEKEYKKFINEDKNIKEFKKSNESIEVKLKKKFICQYQKYWGDISYRKVLCSTLSVAMWDDHDITDGWGSRPEFFDSKENTDFKAEWWKFFEIASEVFKIYQASRNPKSIYKFSSVLEWGDKRFVLADFRSERNSKRNQLWTDTHKNKVLSELKETPEEIKQVFFVSPVIALRTNFSDDRRISEFSKCLFKLKRHIDDKYKSLYLPISIIFVLSPFLIPVLNCFLSEKFLCENSLIPPIIGIILCAIAVIVKIVNLVTKIPHLPDLSDDMEDGLSSSSNMKSLKEIMDCLTNIARRGKEVFILSGDIHIGGLTEIIDTTREEKKAQILQIVSSPISNKPMPKVVAGLTTTTSEMILRECYDDKRKRLFARNIFYLSKRNFVQVFPDRKEGNIAFHFEGHQFPTVFPKKFS